MEGFFPSSEVECAPPVPLFPKCETCKLYKHCTSGKMPVTGKGKKRILILGEAPGEEEDRKNIQFYGKSGQYLQKVLTRHSIDMRYDCKNTNAIICRPMDKRGQNRKPTDRELEYCYPNLAKTLKEFNPEIIVPLGLQAVKQLLRGIWNDKFISMTRWAGWVIPDQTLNAWICPSYHPSYCIRQQDPVLDLIFSNHIKAVSELEGRPWDKIPNYKKKVEILVDADEAAQAIHAIHTHNSDVEGMVAFDYETNMLKPDSDKAAIYSCSLSDGKMTIAFPWVRQTRMMMGKLLKDKRVKKVNSNIKYEERWTIKEFGFPVANWDWDTMNGAHWLDNRSAITGLKFQAYVLLGLPTYNDFMKQYLKSKGGGANSVNRIDEVNLEDLLLYNGLDSFLARKIAPMQKRIGQWDSLKR